MYLDLKQIPSCKGLVRKYLQNIHIVTCMGDTRDGMAGSSSDDWILLSLRLQPLSRIIASHSTSSSPGSQLAHCLLPSNKLSTLAVENRLSSVVSCGVSRDHIA
jgi:hypothetical protein